MPKLQTKSHKYCFLNYEKVLQILLKKCKGLRVPEVYNSAAKLKKGSKIGTGLKQLVGVDKRF